MTRNADELAEAIETAIGASEESVMTEGGGKRISLTLAQAEKLLARRDDGVRSPLNAAVVWATDAVQNGGDPVKSIEALRDATGVDSPAETQRRTPNRSLSGPSYTTRYDGRDDQPPRDVYSGEALDL